MSEYKDTAVFTMAALASSTILQPHDFEPATAKRHSEVENCMHGVRKYSNTKIRLAYSAIDASAENFRLKL